MPAGKLVNLAVFDMTFQGKPPVPPLATLTWKDWRGAPVVAFPRRRHAVRGQLTAARVPRRASTRPHAGPARPAVVSAPMPL